jgi:hypothetical protein
LMLARVDFKVPLLGSAKYKIGIHNNP